MARRRLAHHPELRRRDAPDEFVHVDAVNADDVLITAWLEGRSGEPGEGWPDGLDQDEQIATMVAAWRADMQVWPVPKLVSVDRAMAVLARARLWRRLVPLAGAAAVLVAVCSGLTIGVGTAEPGDPLWVLSRVVDRERADSVEAAAEVKAGLLAVRTALSEGRADVAVRELAEVQAELPAVRVTEGRDELAAEQRLLAAKAAELRPGTRTDPATGPGRTEPGVPTEPPPPPAIRSERPTVPTEPAASGPVGPTPRPASSQEESDRARGADEGGRSAANIEIIVLRLGLGSEADDAC